MTDINSHFFSYPGRNPDRVDPLREVIPAEGARTDYHYNMSDSKQPSFPEVLTQVLRDRGVIEPDQEVLPDEPIEQAVQRLRVRLGVLDVAFQAHKEVEAAFQADPVAAAAKYKRAASPRPPDAGGQVDAQA